MKTGTYSDDRITVKKLIHDVDFEKLKKQMQSIYSAQTILTVQGGKEKLDIVTNLDGIIAYLDEMRDIAVDVYDYKEKKVFNITKK